MSYEKKKDIVPISIREHLMMFFIGLFSERTSWRLNNMYSAGFEIVLFSRKTFILSHSMSHSHVKLMCTCAEGKMELARFKWCLCV